VAPAALAAVPATPGAAVATFPAVPANLAALAAFLSSMVFLAPATNSLPPPLITSTTFFSPSSFISSVIS
jgi:hypothetical protein